MYGIDAYGESSYGTSGSVAEAGFIAANIVPSFSASLLVGTSSTLSVTLLPIAQFGSDNTPRTSTINVESGIQASFTSTIPVYAVGLINPVVSASIFGSTTVSGTLSATVQPVAVIYGNSPNPITLSTTIRVRPTIIGYTPPAGVISVQLRPVAAMRLLAVPFIKLNAVIPLFANMDGTTGVTGVLSITAQPVFSASASFGTAGSFSSAIRPICLFSALHGNALLADIKPSVVASMFGGAYQYIQGNINATVPISADIRGVFGEQEFPQTVFVMTKQNTAFVQQ